MLSCCVRRSRPNSKRSRGDSSFSTRVPAEITSQICSFLCDHCLEVPEDEINFGSDGQRALSNLSLTCRQLRPIAQAYLFHKISLRHGLLQYNRAIDTRNFNVLHTLIQHPQLALHIQDLTFGRTGLWNTIDRQKLLYDTLVKERLHPSAHGPTASVYYDDPTFTDVTRQLYVALASNLTTLRYPMSATHGARLCYRNFLSLDNESPGLPNLRTLTVFPDSGHVLTICDEVFLSMLNAAPNLTTLIIEEAFGITRNPNFPSLPVPNLSKLESLSFRFSRLIGCSNDVGLDYLTRFVRAAPKLRRFQYDAGPMLEYDISGNAVLDILASHKEILQDLAISFNKCFQQLGEPINVGYLKEFTSLKILRLDDAAFCQRRPFLSTVNPFPNETNGVCNSTCLTELLPATVEVLHLNLYYNAMAQQDAMSLSTKAGSLGFSTLAHIQVDSPTLLPSLGAIEIFSLEEIYKECSKMATHEKRVLLAFLKAGVRVWIRESGRFDDADAGSTLAHISLR